MNPSTSVSTNRSIKRKLHYCSYCPYTSNYTSHVTAHVRTHTGERPFVCTICNKGFTEKQALKHHKVTHIMDDD